MLFIFCNKRIRQVSHLKHIVDSCANVYFFTFYMEVSVGLPRLVGFVEICS